MKEDGSHEEERRDALNIEKIPDASAEHPRTRSQGRGGGGADIEAQALSHHDGGGEEERGGEEKGEEDHGSSSTTTTTTTAKLPFSKARCIALAATLTGASFLNTLSIQSVVIILPTIGEDLGIPEGRLQWVVSSYALTFGCFLLLWGRVADLYGKRRIFILGSAFIAATLIANPFLTNEIAFNLFRGLQGLGAAANVPTAIGILGVTFPPGKAKTYAFSSYAAGAPLGSVFGNLIAGFISSYASWKWVFGATGGLAVLVTAAGILFIPPPPPHVAGKKGGVVLLKTVDWAGGFLVTAGLLALLFALAEGNTAGWDQVWIYLLIVIALLLIALFVVWQWYQETHLGGRARKPLMKVSLFRNPRFSAAMVIMALFFAAFSDYLVEAVLFFDYQGLDPLQKTLRFIPTGVSGVVTAFVVSHLISRVPGWILLMFGNFSVSLSCLLFAIPLPDSTSYFAFGLPAMVLSVFGADTAWPTLTLFVSKSLAPEDQALGGALINSMGQIGRAIGLAVTTAIQTAVMARERGVPADESGEIEPWDPASAAGLRAGFWFNFALAICCMIVVGLCFRGTGILGEAQRRKHRRSADSAVVRQLEGSEKA
ncbi:drug resistance protein [Xylariomycetidae sp. FL2044]|nr:drug resistance protein [Xylariomycetidae sp. FL2044]